MKMKIKNADSEEKERKVLAELRSEDPSWLVNLRDFYHNNHNKISEVGK
jgi:hypothetical protein